MVAQHVRLLSKTQPSSVALLHELLTELSESLKNMIDKITTNVTGIRKEAWDWLGGEEFGH